MSSPKFDKTTLTIIRRLKSRNNQGELNEVDKM